MNTGKQEKADRLMEAAAAILEAAPGHKLNIVLLNKALFYLDLCSLRDFGDTVTHASYIALDMGPVVAKYPKHLVGELKTRGIAEQIREGISKPMTLRAKVQPRFMNQGQLAHASKVAEWAARQTSAAASDISHQNPGWEIAHEAGHATGQKQVINLTIAMQQIIEPDPWLDEKPDEELLKAFAMAGATESQPW